MVAGGGGASPSDSNYASGAGSSIGGGARNQILQNYATIGGGLFNRALGQSTTISGGDSNQTQEAFATVAGGKLNSATDLFSTVSGGYANFATGGYSSIGGGSLNYASEQYTSVGGGYGNQATAQYCAIAGGFQNQAVSAGGTVSGGYQNYADGGVSTVGGGQANVTLGSGSTIAGGLFNYGGANGIAIGGGKFNRAGGLFAVIAGGGGEFPADSNLALSMNATIGGGRANRAINTNATISGGSSNTASGIGSAIPGGQNNEAAGSYAFAAGNNAHATHSGSFVWNDGFGVNLSSSANDQFSARASGGYRFFTTTGAVGAQLPAGATAWSVLSDSTMKKDRQRANTKAVLSKLAALNIDTWRYKHQPTGPLHMGPMAQDLYNAYGLGDDETMISTIDADGVLFAAVQELAKENAQKDTKIADLETRVKQLEAAILQFGNLIQTDKQ
ncbi:MAG: tail fiber domain-containing protein [bacterium]|nr:tail fiber domain-containing protein [bacterium]